MTTGGPPDRPPNIRRIPESPDPVSDDDSAPQTSIIRRYPTGALPVLRVPVRDDDAQTTFVPSATPEDDDQTTYVPRATPSAVGSSVAARPGPTTAAAAATVSILSGWATAVIATSLISAWWRSDELFCIAIGFLTAVSAAATIGGLIALLLGRCTGRVLIVVGSLIALMIFAGLFVADARLPPIVYAIPALPVASIVLALLPATGRWCR